VRNPLPAVPTALPEVSVVAAGAGRAARGVPSVGFCFTATGGDETGTPDETGAVPAGPVLPDAAFPADWVRTVGLTGKAGEVHPAPAGSGLAWVAGVGDGSPKHWRTAGAALVRAVRSRLRTDADAGRRPRRGLRVHLPPGIGGDEVAELVRGLRLGGYRFTVSAERPDPGLASVELVADADRRAELADVADRAQALTAATALARDLANAPSNVKDPAWLADTASRVAGSVRGLGVLVRDERWLAEQGFGGVLAVGGGSSRPPRLIELAWRPRGTDGPHLVLVGKGITFDTGGISIKPAEGMHMMRTDMAGGAAVIAAMTVVARLELPVRVTALVPCAENHVSGAAYRPGDIVRHYGGRTTEVTNTDAEGRMVLADALAYAVTRLRPDALVDVATLTGAMKVSLGLRTGGLFASDDALAERVLAAGATAGESWWRMPLASDVDSLGAELADAVTSEIADVRQCPSGPGGITAAMFLREFTGGLPWAHLDIAGPARADKEYDDVTTGATGFATRTLVELARSFADA